MILLIILLKKLIKLIAGNHPLELYSKRIEAIKWFEKNHLNDFYYHSNKYIRFLLNKTKISRFLSYKGKVESKKDILEKYKLL